MSEQDQQPDYQFDFYRQMRESIWTWLKGQGVNYQFADYLLAAPDLFYLLCKLAIDNEVPVSEKAQLAAAIVYFISPFDLIPETLLGPLGYIDDIAVAAFVLNNLINKTNPEIVRRHWAGDKDILDLIQQIIRVADEMIGSGLWAKIRKSFDKDG